MQWNIFLSALFFLLLPALPLEAKPSSPSRELGMWVWKHEDLNTAEGHDRLLAFSKRNGITRLFVEITFEGAEGARRLASQGALKELLAKAHKQGFLIEALDGHREMSLEKCRADTLQKLDEVLAFQKSLPEDGRFAGLHYDIEPYLVQRWADGDEHGIMSETLETMRLIREKVTPEAHLSLAYDIPSWYDRHPDTLSIEFNGEKKNFHEHIQDLSDYIGIMSYRREPTGPGSILDICKAELAYGAKVGKPVYPSMETGRLKDEPEITFYGTGPEPFHAALKEVQKCDSPAFGGVFLHYYESLIDLLGRE